MAKLMPIPETSVYNEMEARSFDLDDTRNRKRVRLHPLVRHPTLNMGRDTETNNLILPNTGTAETLVATRRNHLYFTKCMNECCWYVKDGGSANGTYLNNIKLSPSGWTKLKDKDMLQIGGPQRIKHMRDGKIKVNPYQYVFQSPTAPIKTEEDHAVVKDECFPIKSDADPIDTNDFRQKKIPKLVIPDSIPKDGAIGVAKHLLKLVLNTKSNETMTSHYKDVLISAALDLLKKA